MRLGAGPSSATLVNLHTVRRVALSQANIWSSTDTGRDGYIIAEAVATALRFRADNAMGVRFDPNTPSEIWSARINNRVSEFTALFRLAAQCSPSSLAFLFDNACRRLRSRGELSPK
jgi:hypothetical protein